ncbi:phenylalanine 4-monooxygenase [Marinicella litoralis]|uniref:Phenylalanine-4-hydroxylase n=1 Tax=Marinicella litoralis TaxID=644220 RepID=A0A4R6XE08_9GAMM|nr:phenylalanine 4-monooxygenase [Marinicella litoralis]TDR17556.1 phenylalanine 4-hydroxylase [Marinicella litoralis]
MSRYTSNQYQAKQANAYGLIHYTDNEHRMWSELYQAQISLVHRHMVNEYIEGLHHIDLPSHRIPQCSEVSEKLQKLNGWQVEPVPALIAYDRFFNMLANKRFPAASFIRRQEDFAYVKEPDIFHEIFGHIPLLTHPQVAAFSQFIGELGSNVTADNHAWLARLYWFTIEFGLIKNKNNINGVVPMGSGLASSPTELIYAASSEAPQRRPFDVMDVLTTPYRIDIKQPIYYVLESFDQLAEISARNLVIDILQARKMGLQDPHHLLAKAC